MSDYIGAAVGFGHMYLSIWIALWIQTAEDEDRIGKLICTWFTVFYCRYGVSKLVGEGDMDCIHYTAMYYWFALLFRALWQKAYWLHSQYSTQAWLINFHLSLLSAILNIFMSLEYDRYNAQKLWSNTAMVDGRHGFFDYMSFTFLITYVLLIYQLNKAVFFMWTIMLIDVVSINKPDTLARQSFM